MGVNRVDDFFDPAIVDLDQLHVKARMKPDEIQRCVCVCRSNVRIGVVFTFENRLRDAIAQGHVIDTSHAQMVIREASMQNMNPADSSASFGGDAPEENKYAALSLFIRKVRGMHTHLIGFSDGCHHS